MNEGLAQSLIVHGLVQGVGYRAALLAEARRLGLAGWVMNRRDGSVEALVHGDPAAVEALIAWARQGPPAARVSRIEVAVAEAAAHPGFHVLPTH
jgi:acylphosphatase